MLKTVDIVNTRSGNAAKSQEGHIGCVIGCAVIFAATEDLRECCFNEG